LTRPLPNLGYFNDPAQGKTEAYIGNFKVFAPWLKRRYPPALLKLRLKSKASPAPASCAWPRLPNKSPHKSTSHRPVLADDYIRDRPPAQSRRPPPVQPTPQAASDGSPDAQVLIKTLSGWQEQTSGTAIGITGHPPGICF